MMHVRASHTTSETSYFVVCHTDGVALPATIVVALDNKSPTVHIFSAASAGAIATAITHPFDVIKVPHI